MDLKIKLTKNNMIKPKTTGRKKEPVMATLVIHDLPTMTPKQFGNLLVWLESKFEEMQRAKLSDYSKKFTSRLYK